jgi:hypothetical protein
VEGGRGVTIWLHNSPGAASEAAVGGGEGLQYVYTRVALQMPRNCTVRGTVDVKMEVKKVNIEVKGKSETGNFNKKFTILLYILNSV